MGKDPFEWTFTPDELRRINRYNKYDRFLADGVSLHDLTPEENVARHRELACAWWHRGRMVVSVPGHDPRARLR